MELINNNFTKIPTKVFNLGLKTNEYVLLFYLFSIFNNGNIYPSRKKIAEKTNISIKTVDRVIKSLCNKGYITYKKGFRGKSNQYKINLDKIDPECYKLKKDSENEENIDINEIIRKSLQEYGN